MPKIGSSTNPWFWTTLTLLHERPMHPYEIQQLTRQRHKDLFADHKPGSLYGVIDRLVADQSIEPVSTERTGRRPERTVYRITATGRTQLTEWLDSELGTFEVKDLPRFAFAVEKLAHVDPERAVSLLSCRSAKIAAHIAELTQAIAAMQAAEVPDVSRVEVDYAIAVRTAELDWLRQLITNIEQSRLIWTVARQETSQ